MTTDQEAEAKRLLHVALSCAHKLRVSYLRREVSPRFEYDQLINEIDAIGDLLRKNDD